VALISIASWPPSAHRAKNTSRVQQRAHTAGGCLYFGLLLPPFVEAHQIDSSAMGVEVAVYAWWHRRRTAGFKAALFNLPSTQHGLHFTKNDAKSFQGMISVVYAVQ
jgi:hypothetical protein